MVSNIQQLLTELTEAGVRYLVVGGVAVVLHGYLRTTADLDLVLDLESGNVGRAIAVLERIGFQPRAPVLLTAFADRDQRERWVAEKHLQVFSLWHRNIPGFELDLFVTPPFDFEEAYARASVVSVMGSDLSVASIADLITMKRNTGRPRDEEDVQALEALQRANERRV